MSLLFSSASKVELARDWFSLLGFPSKATCSNCIAKFLNGYLIVFLFFFMNIDLTPYRPVALGVGLIKNCFCIVEPGTTGQPCKH